MVETKETLQKHGVVFALWDGNKIQLEERIASGGFQGFVLIPGGKVEPGENDYEALMREAYEEYGVTVSEYESLGEVSNTEDSGVLNIRHIYLVTKWEGELSNPENKNKHLETGIAQARLLCTHPISQEILDLIEAKLSRQNR